jgi:hypothetical protein
MNNVNDIQMSSNGRNLGDYYPPPAHHQMRTDNLRVSDALRAHLIREAQNQKLGWGPGMPTQGYHHQDM